MSKPKILTDIENKADGKAKIITGDIFTFNYGELEQIFSVTDIDNIFNLPVQLVGQLKFIPHGWGGTLIYTVVIYGATGNTYISTSNANGWSEWKKVTTESDLIANDLIKLTSYKTLYVTTTGSDTSGDGSNAKPFATIQKAINTLPKNLGNNDVRVYLGAGTYAGFNIIAFRNGVLKIIGGANLYEATSYNINSNISIYNCDLRRMDISSINTTSNIVVNNSNCVITRRC